MTKKILLTGSTDGIGRETARMLVKQGHTVLLHGRSPQKLDKLAKELTASGGSVETYVADLSRMGDVKAMAKAVAKNHTSLDVLINNAGVFAVPQVTTDDGLDTRFAVNTIAPYLLTRLLLPLLGNGGRVVNLSSAAQAPLNPKDLAGPSNQSHGMVYAQSKLALTMWNNHLAATLGSDGPVMIAVNPKSMLGSKMVKEAYGVDGADLRIGADILCRAALSDAFADASGQYFDNDIGRFSSPHPDALDPVKCERVVRVMEEVLARIAE